MKKILAGLVMVAAGVIFGCGGGGGQTGSTDSSATSPTIVVPSVASVFQGEGIYSIQGSAMDGVAGIDLNISYPYPDLSSPSVTQGGLISGAMMVANTNTPGNIKIAIINSKAFSGSGEIVRITFANKGSGTLSITAGMINASGDKML